MKTQADLTNEKMAAGKLQGFFDEFPWLNNFVRFGYIEKGISQAYVFGIDPSIGQYAPIEGEKIWLLDNNHKLIEFKVSEPIWEKRFKLFGKEIKTGSKEVRIRGIVEPGDKIWRAMNRLDSSFNNERHAVYCILSYHEEKESLIIYRPPKGLSVEQQIIKVVEQQRKAAKLELEKTCGEIDSASKPEGFPEEYVI